MFKLKKKWIIIIIVALLIAGYFGFNLIFKKSNNNYLTERVGRGIVTQTVSETGNVKATDNIELGFKSSGIIRSINVVVGQDVKKGDILVKLNTDQLNIQLQEAKAALEVAKMEYDKLINGATPEDIKVTEDAKLAAEDDLNSAYTAAINTLNDAYTKIYNTNTTVNSIQSTYFTLADQQGLKVTDSRSVIQQSIVDINSYLKKAKASGAKEDIDVAISRTLTNLNNVYDALKIVRDTCDEVMYYSKISTTDKTSLDTQKTNINTALTNVTTSQQDISSYKIALQKAENSLALKIAKPRSEDVDLYQAEIDKAQAEVSLLQSQIEDMYLRSPIDGKITKVNNKTGEVVSANESVINLLSADPFQIKADIYEQDIVNVKINDSVEITLIAFPKETFLGKVVFIDPAEKIIDNVVYYEITIDFSNQPSGVLSGMTADIVIKTNEKDNVLRLPKNAVETIDNTEMVRVMKNNKPENKIITTGLEGNDYVEVLFGLAEGEVIITGKK